MTLCHGPGCRNPQTVPYWCSEICSERWNARWGKRLPSVEPITLTPDQMDIVSCAVNPDPAPAWLPKVEAIPGRHIAIVELVEESTPFLMGWLSGAAYPQVASEEPQVAVERGWLSRWLDRMFGRTS